MATRFRPRNGLEQIVAAMVARKVQAITDEVADVARDNAPGTKTWHTVGDEEVRPEHRDAHGQEVPENLRFVVDSPDYDQAHYGAPPKQQLRHPRDRDATPGLTVNCRCQAIEDPAGLARGIEAHPVEIRGSTVVGHVTSVGPRVSDAEFGTAQDDAARYMGRAVQEVAARHRAR
ncbi:phage minor head protein [Micromonospora aurantiaca (nom. illeg.)]|uniref:phage minor head protein n=1 Tax=Micromonospora aurantiaca (nom. illeg.) TaxID=47850 RepID=UPI003F4A8096